MSVAGPSNPHRALTLLAQSELCCLEMFPKPNIIFYLRKDALYHFQWSMVGQPQKQITFEEEDVLSVFASNITL